MPTIRQPAVANAFYPSNVRTLTDDIAAMLKAAQTHATQTLPKAIIVPHAGYVYSGTIAAAAYASLARGRDTIKRVIMMGPTHRVAVHGLALPGLDGFATPLGIIPLCEHAIELAKQLHQVVTSLAAHAMEHSLEVQLPFLQMVLTDFKLVPFAVGNATPTEVAEVLDLLWGGDETLIVISSDLSHLLSYNVARNTDQNTVQNILELNGPLNHEQACGGTPINGLLLAAKHHNLHPVLLNACNSGDTAGDKNRVVGYASFAFLEEDSDHVH